MKPHVFMQYCMSKQEKIISKLFYCLQVYLTSQAAKVWLYVEVGTTNSWIDSSSQVMVVDQQENISNAIDLLSKQQCICNRLLQFKAGCPAEIMNSVYNCGWTGVAKCCFE